MMDREQALRKIKKCIALAGSDVPAEAERAMQQAQALMTEFDLSELDVHAAEIGEEWCKSRAKQNPQRHEVNLAGAVADAFACDLVFHRKLNRTQTDFVGGYSFIGKKQNALLAGYMFDVLSGKMYSARAAFIKEKLKRYRKNKVAAADEYCRGWVHSVMRRITKTGRTEQDSLAINAFKAAEFGELSPTSVSARNVAKHVNRQALFVAGLDAGRGVEVHAGVGKGAAPLQLEGA